LRRPPCLGAPAAFPAGRARHPQSAPGVHLRTGGFRPPIALPRPGGGVAARVARLARERGAAGAAARRDPGPLWRRERPGPERRGAPRRTHPGARRGAARGGGVSGLLCWICHLLSLPRGAAPRIGRAAPAGPPQTRAGGQRRHRRGAGRNLSARLPRRLASHRPDPPHAVRPCGLPAAAPAHGRPRPFRAGPGGAPVNRLHTLAPGFQTTVQDLGRFGYAHFGISASGAADPLALRVGNLLVGNDENAPALEMTLTGGEFAFEGPAVIALTGADFDASVPMWQPVEIRPGETVRLGPARNGARCYLALRGGLDVPLAMGSASAHVMTGVGGRPLRTGDLLPIGDRAVRRPRKPALGAPAHNGMACLRTTAGPQARWFGDELDLLYGAEYGGSEESNRMGICLQGPALLSPGGHMITEGVSLGDHV